MPSNGRSRDISPDVLVWDQVVKKISAHSQGRDAIGLLLGSGRAPADNGPYVVMVEDIVEARPLSSQNGEFSQTILSDLLDDWRNNHRGKQIVGWFRTISTPPRQLRLQEGDSAIHQSYFTQPYQVALAFSQQSTAVDVGFFKSNQGTLDVERIYPFTELSDSHSPTGLSIRNLSVAENFQQAVDSDGGRRRTTQSNQWSLPLILRLGLPLLILLAVLTPLLIHSDVIETGRVPADSTNLIELVIPSADDQRMPLIGPDKLNGPAEGIRSITFMKPGASGDEQEGTLWIERLAGNPLDANPPGSFVDYAYYSIASDGMDERRTIEFSFEIPEHWKELRDIGLHTIRAYRSSGNGWVELMNIGEVSFDQGKYVFEARSEGFSYFALGGTEANQPVSVTVEIPENYQQIIESIDLAKGNENCDRLNDPPNVSFECELGIELSLLPKYRQGSVRFTKWIIDGQEYSISESVRITSNTIIEPVIKTQPAPTPTLESTPPPSQLETPDPTSQPGPSEPLEPAGTPGPLNVSTVKISYKVDPPGSGKITIYQDSDGKIPCEFDSEPPNEYLGFLCPADSEILLFADPEPKFELEEIVIETNNVELTSETGGLSRNYRLETTNVVVSVSFIAND